MFRSPPTQPRCAETPFPGKAAVSDEATRYIPSSLDPLVSIKRERIGILPPVNSKR